MCAECVLGGRKWQGSPWVPGHHRKYVGARVARPGRSGRAAGVTVCRCDGVTVCAHTVARYRPLTLLVTKPLPPRHVLLLLLLLLLPPLQVLELNKRLQQAHDMVSRQLRQRQCRAVPCGAAMASTAGDRRREQQHRGCRRTAPAFPC